MSLTTRSYNFRPSKSSNITNLLHGTVFIKRLDTSNVNNAYVSGIKEELKLNSNQSVFCSSNLPREGYELWLN
jgi:hypothetical protein